MRKFKPQVRTKNSSSNDLRSANTGIGEFDVRSIVRLGSLTSTEAAFRRAPVNVPIVEVNSVEAVQNSRNKLLMKGCFKEAEIPQSDWFAWKDEDVFTNQITNEEINISDLLNTLTSGILMKRVCGFKGKGMFLIKTMEDWVNFKAVAKKRYPDLEY